MQNKRDCINRHRAKGQAAAGSLSISVLLLAEVSVQQVTHHCLIFHIQSSVIKIDSFISHVCQPKDSFPSFWK